MKEVSNSIKCGFYESEVTPPLGLTIPGYPDKRLATGVLTRLYSKAAAFEKDGVGMIMISVDAISAGQTVMDIALERIVKATGIPADNIMIHSTHTHTGGPCRESVLPSPYYEENPEYMHMLGRLVGDSGILAWQRRQEATAKAAGTEVYGISFIRNYMMADGTVKTNPGVGNPDIRGVFGTLDPEFKFIFFTATDGKPLGMLANFSLHHDTEGGYLYCADYSGVLADMLKERYGKDFSLVFLNGACGNINHVDVNAYPGLFRRDKDGFRRNPDGTVAEPHRVRIGKRLFAVFEEQLPLAKPLAMDVVKGKRELIAIDRTRLPQALIDELKELMKKPIPVGAANPTDPTSESWKRSKAEGTLYNASLPPQKEVWVQALRLGDAMIFATPGEMYTEYGRMMKDGSPLAFSMVAELANTGGIPYVPSLPAFEHSETIYEAHPSAAAFAPDTGTRLAQKAIALSKELV